MNIENIKKPETFEDLLQLQKILDETVGKPRENGFIPRKGTFQDMKLSLDDEFNEWLKELPYELNFKTWKQKSYSKEKELEEITDCLFFYLQIINTCDWGYEDFSNVFKTFMNEMSSNEIKYLILEFKEYLHRFDGIYDSFCVWIEICNSRRFTKEEILNTYWKKWKRNLERINRDWTK